jgi:hypothetical protein
MSEWIEFVAKYRKANPKISFKEALQKASVEYRKKKGTKGAVAVSRVKKGKADDMDFTTKKGDKLKTGKGKGKMAFADDK